MFARLENIPNLAVEEIELQAVLEEIAKKAHKYSMTTNLSAALRTFSGNPNLKRHLPEVIGKLGRYYSAACGPVCAARARECSLFQNIQVERFRVPMLTSVQDAKVHAEMQLLFFYELHPDRPRPRIICFSKSACYLCEKWTITDWLDVPGSVTRVLVLFRPA
jgi:hypothetical protein